MVQVNLAEYLLARYRSLKSPESVLFYFNGAEISFLEFESNVYRYARYLATRVGLGDRVVVFLKDSPDAVAMFLGAILTGAIPAWANPKTIPSMIEKTLETYDPNLAIIDECLNPHMPQNFSRTKIISEGEVATQAMSLPPEKPRHIVYPPYDSDAHPDTVLMQFTSGSTGTPKAVMHSADGILAFCRIFAEQALGITPEDKIYSVPRLFFGYGMGNSLFFPLYCGASAILESDWPSPSNVLHTLKSHRPSVFFAAPTIYNNLLDFGVDESIMKSVRIAFSAGSPLSATIFRRAKTAWDIDIVDGLGCTEMGHVFLANDSKAPSAGISGTLLPGYNGILVNSVAPPDPPFTNRGELLVEGPSIALGYFRNEIETGAKFLDVGYKTGDEFQITASGEYSYMGRIDECFKSKGRWVTPGPIEAMILQAFPTITEAALVPYTINSEAVPYLFLVTQKQSNLEQLRSSIHTHMRSNIEAHCRPREIIFVEKFPRNANQKIQRKILEKLEVMPYAEH